MENLMADYGAIDLSKMKINYRGIANGVLDMLVPDDLVVVRLGMIPVHVIDMVTRLAEEKFAKSSITRKVTPEAMAEFKSEFAIQLISVAGDRGLLLGMEDNNKS